MKAGIFIHQRDPGMTNPGKETQGPSPAPELYNEESSALTFLAPEICFRHQSGDHVREMLAIAIAIAGLLEVGTR